MIRFVGVIVEKEGGVDENLMAVSDKLRNAYGRLRVNEPSLTALADIISIIRYYTNVGIGYAYSIEYVKTALSGLEMAVRRKT